MDEALGGGHGLMVTEWQRLVWVKRKTSSLK